MIQEKSFSVTGKTNDGSNTLTFTLRVIEESISVWENRSNVVVDAFLQQSETGVSFQNCTTRIQCSLNGRYSFFESTGNSLMGNQQKQYASWETDVIHDDDGSFELEVSGNLRIYDSENKPIADLQIRGQTMNLSQISRFSSVGAADANIGSNTTIVLVPADSSYRHSIRYQFGELTGYIRADGQISAGETLVSERVISFPVPESFYDQIPNKKQMACQLEVRAYAAGRFVGLTETSFTVTADKELCKPLLTASVEDINEVTLAATGDPDTMVRYCSTAQCQATAQSRNGALLESVTVNGMPIDGELVVSNAETGTFLFLAADSRGYRTEQQVRKNLIPYVCLTCNPTACRTAPTTGQVALTVAGNCWKGNFGATENTLTGSYRVDSGQWQPLNLTIREDHTYETQLLLEELDYRLGHVIEVSVTDKMGTVKANVYVGRGLPVFDWGEDYFNFHVPVHFGAGATGLT